MAEVTNSAEKTRYLSELAEVSERSAPDAVRAVRAEGLRLFGELEYPHRRMEAWRFTNVNPIVRTPFATVTNPAQHGLERPDLARFTYPDQDWIELVFVDGFLAPELSRGLEGEPGVRVLNLASWTGDDPAWVDHFGRRLNGSSSAFTALNAAFSLDGAMVHVARDAAPPRPIHLVYVTTTQGKASAVHPRNLVVLEENARATLVETYVATDPSEVRWTNAVTEAVLGEGADLYRVKVLDDGPGSFHLATTAVSQGRSSRFRSFVFAFGGRIDRDELCVDLDGEGAECALNGLHLTDDGQLMDNAATIAHKAPRCKSWIGYKGVLDGKSNSVFMGRIDVHRGAQQTDSRQLNQTLLLSDKATVNTRPQLEIYADDVKCTHGATVGPPPEEEIFYFRTRGMSEAMGRGLLTYGFADEVVSELEIAPIRERLDRHVFEKYRPE